MGTFRFIFSLILIHLVYLRSVYSKDCLGRDQCSCAFDTDSSVVDLTSLGNSDLTPRFKDVQSDDSNQYSYNPCYPFEEGSCSQVAVCQVSTVGTQTDVGSAQNVQFQYDEGADQVTVTYTEGGGGILQTTTVALVCDPKACTPSLTANGVQSPGTYLLTLKTVCACPNGCDSSGPTNCDPSPPPKGGSGGIGGGGIFLIIFFSVLVIYLVGGVLFMKFVRKAEGSDVIPNKSFWVALPSAIKICTVQNGQEIEIGQTVNNIWTYVEETSNVVVTYVGGPSTPVTVTQVILACDPHACTPSLTADGLQGLGTYQLTLKTVCACPNGCNEKGPMKCIPGSSAGAVIGGGTIFLIIFASMLVLYLLGGMIFMKFVRKATGSDVIPNKSFWVGLPSSIKAGFLFVLSPVIRRKKYDSI